MDIVDGGRYCRPVCIHSFYSLPGMIVCEPWLNCDDIKKLKPVKIIARANVKMVVNR